MEVIAATRQGTQVYIHEDFTFRKTREVKDRVYVRCCVRGCPSTAVVKGEDVVLRRPHNHEPETVRIEKLRLREDLRLSAMKHGARQNMRRIFEETCGKHSPVALIDYKSIRSSMYRAKRLKDFAIPANLGEYSDVLAERDELGKTKDDPPQPFFQRYIERRTRTSKGEEQWSAVIFISPTLKQLLTSSSTLHIDASSKAVPKELGQRLLTIHVLYMEHLFPVVYVLINGSPEDSYAGVLNEVVAICPETRLAAQFIITDYDLAMMNAANSAWPNASVTGCFFHFAQDIFRKHITLNMRPIVLGNDNAKTALQMMMSLPLLPPGLIVDGLHEIHQYLLENGLQASFSQLVEYMEEYWMTTVGPHNVSVYQQMHRTNNGIAGFYFYLLSKMGSSRGVWQFTDVLLAVEHTYTSDYTKLLNGRAISSDRRKGQRTQDLGIEKCWKSLNDKGFHLLSCLITASHAVEGLEERVKELMRVEGNPPPIVTPVSVKLPGNSSNNESPSSGNGNSSSSVGGPSSSDGVSGCTSTVGGSSSEVGGSAVPIGATLSGSSRVGVGSATSNEGTSIPMGVTSQVSGNLIDSVGGSIVNLRGSSAGSHLNTIGASLTPLGPTIINRAPVSIFGGHNQHGYRI